MHACARFGTLTRPLRPSWWGRLTGLEPTQVRQSWFRTPLPPVDPAHDTIRTLPPRRSAISLGVGHTS